MDGWAPMWVVWQENAIELYYIQTQGRAVECITAGSSLPVYSYGYTLKNCIV